MKSEVKLETPQKVSCYNSVSYKFVLKSVKSQNRICLVIQYQFKASACKIWWTKTKLSFWETKTILQILGKLFLSIGVSFEVYQTPQSNLLGLGRFIQGVRMPNLVDQYKIICLGKRGKAWNYPKTLSYIGFSYKFVWKSVKSLNGIFWAIESCYKILECQIWQTNINFFSWGNKSKLETLKNLSPYIGVSFKCVCKSVESLNRIFSVIEYWFKALEWQICWTNTKLFLWETEKNLGTLQKLSSYFGVSNKFVWKSVEILN